tara:strand:- start:475 stop:609 length:135 start_codon:yes stop_codon:yes gene_type:complete
MIGGVWGLKILVSFSEALKDWTTGGLVKSLSRAMRWAAGWGVGI